MRAIQAEKAYQSCVSALQTFMDEKGFSEVVLGLSGGIDSALACVMCTDALGASCVHAVLMPGPYSTKHSVTDACRLAQNLALDTLTIPIDTSYCAFAKAFEKACGKNLAGLAAENVQARCRMVTLMMLANTYGWMLVNTSNKSEALMGYSTLYGDMAGAFAPLGDLYKTDVYTLARWRNARGMCVCGTPPIPCSTLTKPPSAELSAGQSDEASMGITYELLDRLLFELTERKSDKNALTEAGFSKEDIDRVCAAYHKSAFKRQLLPPHPHLF